MIWTIYAFAAIGAAIALPIAAWFMWVLAPFWIGPAIALVIIGAALVVAAIPEGRK